MGVLPMITEYGKEVYGPSENVIVPQTVVTGQFFVGNVAGVEWIAAQTFELNRDFLLEMLEIRHLGNIGAPQPSICRLYATLAGAPTGSSLLSTNSLTAGQVAAYGLPAYVPYTYTENYLIPKDTVFAVSLETTLPAVGPNDHYQWGVGANAYPDGIGYIKQAAGAWAPQAALDCVVRIIGRLVGDSAGEIINSKRIIDINNKYDAAYVVGARVGADNNRVSGTFPEKGSDEWPAAPHVFFLKDESVKSDGMARQRAYHIVMKYRNGVERVSMEFKSKLHAHRKGDLYLLRNDREGIIGRHRLLSISHSVNKSNLSRRTAEFEKF